jgi:HSP20 family molecular chaperone IbpA
VSYERFLQLPKTIDAGKLSATMSKGILTLTLPKVEELKPRTIEVLAS